jgi:hypothetical protein
MGQGPLALTYVMLGAPLAYFHVTAGVVLEFDRGAATAGLQVDQGLLQLAAFRLLGWHQKRPKYTWVKAD